MLLLFVGGVMNLVWIADWPFLFWWKSLLPRATG